MHYREHIIAILISCLVATALARILALSLPFRLRPVHEEDLKFVIPHGLDPTALDGWSSFPSDHAVLFFGLSTGILFISRKIGVFALIYTALFISLPRIYVGVHYLTDIVVGAIIGITIVLLGNRYFTKSRNIQLISNCSYSRPDIFYPLFFLLTYQIIDLFSGSRAILKTGVKSILSIFGFTT